ncbi:Protein atonal-like protein, partial [Stegodyphus mimosarum]
MASSPNCSSTSPSASTATTSTDLQETDAFSDDSGVDVKPQCKKANPMFFAQEPDLAIESGKRNKRKSSEPKKRKDVLLMKRFRWDSDEDEKDDDEVDDVFEAIERERPSSGDSGCQIDRPSTVTSSQGLEKKRKQRQWRKPKVETYPPIVKQEVPLPTFRQSVIRKHEASSACIGSGSRTNISHCSSKDLSSVASLSNSETPLTTPTDLSSSLASPSLSSIAKPVSSRDYDLILEGQDDSNEPTSSRSSRTLGRPRNYKSMSRQRRIEANARERTRVHTISAAFESLRRAVPAYAHNQKLSKLAILRIASAYIVALACLNQQDYSQEQNRPSLAECVEQCTRTIQAEGRSRRRTTKE